MTVKELKEELNKYSDLCDVAAINTNSGHFLKINKILPADNETLTNEIYILTYEEIRADNIKNVECSKPCKKDDKGNKKLTEKILFNWIEI